MDFIPADLEPHSVPGTSPHIALETNKVPSAVESHSAAGDSDSGDMENFNNLDAYENRRA